MSGKFRKTWSGLQGGVDVAPASSLAALSVPNLRKTMTKLKFHEKKLLNQVNFWKGELKEVTEKIMLCNAIMLLDIMITRTSARSGAALSVPGRSELSSEAPCSELKMFDVSVKKVKALSFCDQQLQ
ncbi:hypothetical protein K1719_028435 [Acacia pycnantha]|nr:hypothetical protein K1719_028435 [Acacia pycnantha]